MTDFKSENQLSLEQILQKKAKIKLRVKSSNVWFTTTVESVNENQVVLAFPEMFAAVDIVLSDTLYCKYSDDKNLYSFEGKVDSIKVYFPQSINLILVGELKVIANTREVRREDTIFLANVLLDGEIKPMCACVNDVSSTGLKLISKHHFKEGANVSIEIALPMRNIFDSIVNLKGKIVWGKFLYDYNEYGVAVTEMDEKFKERILHFIRLSERS